MLASDFSQKGLIGLGTGHPFWQLQTYGHQIFAQGLKLEHIRGFVQAVKRATVVGFDKGRCADVGVDHGFFNNLVRLQSGNLLNAGHMTLLNVDDALAAIEVEPAALVLGVTKRFMYSARAATELLTAARSSSRHGSAALLSIWAWTSS